MFVRFGGARAKSLVRNASPALTDDIRKILHQDSDEFTDDRS